MSDTNYEEFQKKNREHKERRGKGKGLGLDITKAQILLYVCNQDDEGVYVDEIYDYIKAWSEHNHKQAIKHNSGIYNHLKKLEENGLIKVQKRASATRHPADFIKIAHFFLNRGMIRDFMLTNYFMIEHKTHFPFLLQSIGIKNPKVQLTKTEFDIYQFHSEACPSTFEYFLTGKMDNIAKRRVNSSNPIFKMNSSQLSAILNAGMEAMQSKKKIIISNAFLCRIVLANEVRDLANDTYITRKQMSDSSNEMLPKIPNVIGTMLKKIR